jgi:hypothetical protein
MSQAIEEARSVSELSTEIAELKKRVKALEETVTSMKLRMAKKWV